MSKFDDYLNKYKGIKEVLKDVPPKPRVGTLMYLGFAGLTGVICWKIDDPPSLVWVFVISALIFLLIYYDVGKRFKK